MPSVREKQAALIDRLFNGPIPRLWCPPLTHYTADGRIDRERIAAHWRAMLPYVQSFMVPGSTGDGWEQTNAESAEVLDIALDLAQKHGARLVAAALKTDPQSVREFIDQTLTTLKKRSGTVDPLEAMKAARVCGFVVCGPKGPDVGQREIQDYLAGILELDLPTVLYQLPQITENEISPGAMAALAEKYGNLIMFKDSGDNDRVALADQGASGVFLVRGAEGDYADWLQKAGGPYHGFLLSTANCFASHLSELIRLIETSDTGRAREISSRLTETVSRAFNLVADLPHGNPFTNANKAIDHYMAHGPRAAEFETPRLHAGVRLPGEIVTAIGRVLEETGLAPDRGYLEN